MADENVQAEQEAREMGWVPQEEWRGEAEKWVDAQTFIQRGEHVIPILRKTNKELREQQLAMRGEVQGLKEALRAANTAIETLQASHEQDTKEQVAAARAALKEELQSALAEGDHATAADITEKMTQLNTAERESREEKPEKGNSAPAIDPRLKAEVEDWYKQRPEYSTDRRRAALMNAIAVELKQSGNTKMGAAFLDDCQKEVEETLAGGARRGGDSKVESGRGGGNRVPSGGKTYSDLPADAKAVCDRQAQRLVGPNRAHKTLESWRSAYATKYFAQG